jgi:hypothetical protein
MATKLGSRNLCVFVCVLALVHAHGERGGRGGGREEETISDEQILNVPSL